MGAKDCNFLSNLDNALLALQCSGVVNEGNKIVKTLNLAKYFCKVRSKFSSTENIVEVVCADL